MDKSFRGPFIGYNINGGNTISQISYQTTIRTLSWIQNQLGIILKRATQDQIDSILTTREYMEMDIWPSTESVRIINDILVVKLSETAKVRAEYIGENTIEFALIDTPYLSDDATFAWYVYKDGIRIDTRWYQKESNYIYTVTDPGVYYGQIFIRGSYVPAGQFTNEINIEAQTVERKDKVE